MKLFKSLSQKQSLRRLAEESDVAAVVTEECASAEEMLEKGEVETAQLGALAKLPPFRPVAVSLMRLFDRDDVEMHEIVRLVASDVALSSELLALANSPLFAVQTSIRDLQHAVTVLGIDRTKALATTLAMRSFLSSAPKTPILRRFWRHGVATAVIAEAMAPSYGVAKDLAHVAGILHDVGRVALLAAYPDQYADLAVRTYENNESILLAERAQFGLDHCQAGELLSDSWRFPKELKHVAAQHLDTPTGQDLLSVVQTACRIAANFGFAAIAHHDHHTRTDETLKTCVPSAIRKQVIESLKDVDKRILDRLESLDF